MAETASDATSAPLIFLSRMYLMQAQQRLCMLFGGEPGLVSAARLDQCLTAVRSSFEIHPDSFDVIAASYALLTVIRPFRSCNIRLALVSMAVFCAVNDYELEMSLEELANYLKTLNSSEDITHLAQNLYTKKQK